MAGQTSARLGLGLVLGLGLGHLIGGEAGQTRAKAKLGKLGAGMGFRDEAGLRLGLRDRGDYGAGAG